MRRNHLQPLFEALEGRPTEREAVRLIAMYAVIPTTIAGLLASFIFIPPNAPETQLWLYGIGGAVFGALVGLLGIMALYTTCGFRSVTAVTYCFLGGVMGLAFGAALTRALNITTWFPFATAALGAIGAVFIGVRKALPRREEQDPPEWKGPA